jgi:hypothetical protein
MMRMMIAGLALFVAAPAAAQTGEMPVWLVGKWCFTQDDAKICVRYEAPVDGKMRGTDTVTVDGKTTLLSVSVTQIENGRVVRRIENPPGLLFEVPHGPNELVLERQNPTPQQSIRMRYTVSGDVLTIRFTNGGGEPPDQQQYQREREEP